jgi:SAM-dependent methyltransferase
MSAFGRAMMDQIRYPERQVVFQLSAMGTTIPCSCQDFIRIRPEEHRLIRDCLRGIDCPRVLDIGCGVGRHAALVRSFSPEARLTLVETDPGLLSHAGDALPGSETLERIGQLRADSKFDLVLLMGNGLGVFGTEQATREGLGGLARMLSENGRALIEAGNFLGQTFSEIRHTLMYGGASDNFLWGYASRAWVDAELEATGMVAESHTQSTQGGPFFIVKAALTH